MARTRSSGGSEKLIDDKLDGTKRAVAPLRAKVTKKARTSKSAVKIESNDTPEVPNHGASYWLLKAEPDTRIVKGHEVKFSIDDLKEMKVSPWDGVRNHEAKKNMQLMKKGDLAFFYHSNCKVPGIAGVMKVAKEAYPDYTAFDTNAVYYDPKSDKNNPKWFMVDVEYVRHLKRMVPLTEIKEYAESELKDMALVRRGRLSVAKVSPKEWDFILNLSEQKGEE
jgi:predicted RNA-binding protein with PUA-like domain